jgi:hypothetical protein
MALLFRELRPSSAPCTGKKAMKFADFSKPSGLRYRAYRIPRYYHNGYLTLVFKCGIFPRRARFYPGTSQYWNQPSSWFEAACTYMCQFCARVENYRRATRSRENYFSRNHLILLDSFGSYSFSSRSVHSRNESAPSW